LVGGFYGETTILTSGQRKLLRKYREHRQQSFTTAGLLVQLLPRVALSAVLVAVAYFVSEKFCLIVAGFLAGAILREVALAVHAARVLPVILRVIDWDKVDQLLEEPARNA
jgi:hypothetical protein